MTLDEKALTILQRKKITQYDALWEAFYSLTNLKYKRNSRIYKRVKNIIESENAIFYTLTIKDEYLNKTSIETLRRYAKKWCSKYLSSYLGNVDYGDEEKYTGRAHFHIIGNYKIKPNHESWKYGNMDFQRVHTPNSKAISHYIIKLSEHAVKDKTSMIWRSKK